jgi:IS1 family transposase/transposase-like protein
LLYFPLKRLVNFRVIQGEKMGTQLGWWGLCFLLYGVLLNFFAALWLAQNLPDKLTRFDPKTKRAKKEPIPRTPFDCHHCQAQVKVATSSTEPKLNPPRLAPVYSQTKSKRGRPKKIATQGYACPNPQCLYCGCTDPAFHALVGDGCHGKERQIQTFKCQHCKTTFTQRKNTPLYYLKISASEIGQVLTSTALGLDLSAASTVFGFHPSTIRRWLLRAGSHSQVLHQRLFTNLHLPYLQLDELRTRLRSRTQIIWLWTVVDPLTKIMPVLYFGDRTQLSAYTVVHQLVRILAQEVVPIFTSDGLALYYFALTAHFGSWLRQEVRPSQLKAVWQVSSQLLYGQLIKRYQRRKIVKVEQRMAWGEREEMTARLHQLGQGGWLNTSFVERLNLTLRRAVASLARKSWATAQTVALLEAQAYWWRAYYHFVRPHLSLRQSLSKALGRGGKRRAKHYIKRTPAMAAGLTDHLWSVVEFLNYPLPKVV